MTEPSFQPTYKSDREDRGERQWVIEALAESHQDKLVEDVVRLVRGGKEATVYLCRAHASLGVEWLAAKIYRPRKLRHLKNDALYREGRGLIDGEGKTVGARDKRTKRAVQNMTRFGAELRIASWIGHEYEMLSRLHRTGADVPRPYALGPHCIVMEYVGDGARAAPSLHEVTLEPDEAKVLFERVLDNVALLLGQHVVHADLSAYNILYQAGRVVLIDFPQAIDARINRHAPELLARDVQRVCQYFSRFGLREDAADVARDLWDRYQRGELEGDDP